jgi:hypothetical protein
LLQVFSVAGPLRLPLAAPPLAELISGHAEKPAAKRTFCRLVIQSANATADRLQHNLRQISRIGVLQSTLSPEAIDEWRVQIQERPPRFLILRIAQAD